MLNRQSFTPQVQDSDGQSDSKHSDEESRDYLLNNSCENQSEDDHESTDDGFDRFTDRSSRRGEGHHPFKNGRVGHGTL